MKINIGINQDEGVWIDYDEDVSFKIRMASPSILRSARRKAKSKIGLDGNNVEISDNLIDIEDSELWDWIIEDWKGIYISDTEKAKCTKENKLKLIGMSHEHYLFLIRHTVNLTNFAVIKEKEEEKN